MTAPELRPFTIDVSSETLDWITQRVQSARVIPDVIQPEGKEWADGIPGSAVNDLADYWKSSYDWRKVEAKLNSMFKMYTLDIIEGTEIINLHFVHHRSERQGAIPLLFAHGWPGNFTEVEKLLSLTAPEDPSQQAFHIIAPTLPGFVFSSPPQAAGFGFLQIASVYHQLMLNLGYPHYIGQGGDLGSLVLRAMAIIYPKACIGIHVNMLITLPPTPMKNPITLLWLILRWFTPEEKQRLARLQWWLKDESGYSKIHATKPQTISYGLLDSPVGMLAWIREKMESLMEPGYVWDKEMNLQGVRTLPEAVLKKTVPSEVAFGASCFPFDVGYVPLWWAKATLAENIVFWKEHSKGGHFPSVECSEVLKDDIWEFVTKIPEGRRGLLTDNKSLARL